MLYVKYKMKKTVRKKIKMKFKIIYTFDKIKCMKIL